MTLIPMTLEAGSIEGIQASSPACSGMPAMPRSGITASPLVSAVNASAMTSMHSPIGRSAGTSCWLTTKIFMSSEHASCRRSWGSLLCNAHGELARLHAKSEMRPSGPPRRSYERPRVVRRVAVILLALLVACTAPSPSAAPASTARSHVASTQTPSATPQAARLPSAVAFFDAQVGLGTGSTGPEDNSSSIWRTSDGGRSWTTEPLPGTTLRSITVIGSRMAWAGAACGEVDVPCVPGVLASTDGGRTWLRVSREPVVWLSFVDAVHGWAVSPQDPTLAGPVGGVVGTLLATNDGGRTWAQHGNPCRQYGLAPIAVSFADVGHGWIGCAGGGAAGTAPKAVMATVDGGKTWAVRSLVSRPGGPTSVGTITWSGYMTGIAMRGDGIGIQWLDRQSTFRTSDGGRTWKPIPPGSPDVVSVANAWLLDDRHWIAIVFDGSDGHQKVLATHDGGASWQVVAEGSPPA